MIDRGIYEFGNWMLEFSQEWSEWFSGNWNWRNFTLIQVYYEDECHMGNRELVLRLFGVGVRIVHLYDREAAGRVVVNNSMAEIRATQDQTTGEPRGD